MMSSGFRAVDPSLLRLWSKDARYREAASTGHRSEVHFIEIHRDRFVLRHSGRSEEALRWKIDLTKYLHGAGLSVPTLVPTLDGRETVDGFVMTSWLDGDEPHSPADWLEVATELCRLHDLTRDWPQRPGFASTQELMSQDAGGDVRLDLLPGDVALLCRRAWAGIAGEPQSVVHGDPLTNVRLHNGRAGFFDWDEARRDVSILDLADIPGGMGSGANQRSGGTAMRAAHAWEVANSWLIEPEYARRRLRELIESASGSDR